MKMKWALVTAVALTMSVPAAAQTSARAGDVHDIENVLMQYQDSIEKLDASGTERLFATDSEIFETGGSEGNYEHYLAHHLTPELAEFSSFQFGDYKVNVRFEGPIALASETYSYRIATKEGEIAERLGVATSVLRKENGQWKIVSMHNSGRKPPAPQAQTGAKP